MLESWSNRRKIARLVAEVVGGRQGKISRSKVVVVFKTPKAPVTPGLRPGYDQVTTRLRPTFDRKMLESLSNRRKSVRLVTDVVGDRQGKISRGKADGHVQNF